MTSTNRAAFDRAIDRWNAGDLDGYLELYADDIRLHGYSETPMDKVTVTGFYGGLWESLSDVRIEVGQVVEDGDRLAVQAVMSGDHTGELNGLPATGIRIHQPVMTILRFADGRCVERWSLADMLAVLAQLGALPAPA